MCSSISSFQTKSTTVAFFAGLVILAASLVAAYRHLTVISEKLSSVAWFHIANVLFFIIYAVFHMTLLFAGSSTICQCDPFLLLQQVCLGCYLWTWEIFLRYWKQVVHSERLGGVMYWSKKGEVWQARVAAYSALAFANIAAWSHFVVQADPCSRADFHIPYLLGYVTFGTLALDSSILAYVCVRSFSEKAEEASASFGRTRDSRVMRLLENLEETTRSSATRGGASGKINGDSVRRTLVFVSLPLSMWIGLALNIQEQVMFPFFAYFLPTMGMLHLMWDRNYLLVADEARFDEMERSNSSLFQKPPILEAVEAAALQDDEAVTAKVALSLGAVERLKSHMEFSASSLVASGSDSSNRTPPGGSGSRGSSLGGLGQQLSSTSLLGLAGPSQGASVVIAEDLRPPPSTLPFASLYLAGIVLPSLESALHRHRERAAALLVATAPAPQTNALYVTRHWMQHRYPRCVLCVRIPYTSKV